MDASLTAGADVVDVGQADAPDAGPWGLNPKTGQPYKRDPKQMANIRLARFGGGKRANTPKPATKAAGRPAVKATVDKAKTAAYGAACAKWFLRATDAVLKDPVERAIMRRQAVDLALIVDKLLQEDPRIMRWVERLRLKFTGGAKGELLGWSVTTALLFALHRGYQHPMLTLAFGATLDAVKVEAVAYERAQEQERLQMLELLKEYEREEQELLKAYADPKPATNGSAVLGQFT